MKARVPSSVGVLFQKLNIFKLSEASLEDIDAIERIIKTAEVTLDVNVFKGLGYRYLKGRVIVKYQNTNLGTTVGKRSFVLKGIYLHRQVPIAVSFLLGTHVDNEYMLVFTPEQIEYFHKPLSNKLNEESLRLEKMLVLEVPQLSIEEQPILDVLLQGTSPTRNVSLINSMLLKEARKGVKSYIKGSRFKNSNFTDLTVLSRDGLPIALIIKCINSGEDELMVLFSKEQLAQIIPMKNFRDAQELEKKEVARFVSESENAARSWLKNNTSNIDLINSLPDE